MKRNRSEVISGNVNSYMKRRQYRELDYQKKSDLRQECTINEMALKHSLMNCTSTKNLFSFSSMNSDLNAVEQQYSRFKAFISDSCEPMKTELTHLLFPVFFFLHKELLASSKPAAKKFFDKNILLFTNNALYKQIVSKYFRLNVNDALPQSGDPDAVLLSAAESHQFRVKLSSDTSNYLTRFLKNFKQTFILQVLNRNVIFQVSPVEVSDDNLELTASSDNISCPKINGIIEAKENKTDGEMSPQEALMDAIRRVNETKPCLPSICNYALSSPSVGICSIDLSPDLTMLCAGFTDSSIRLFNLTPLPLFLSQTKSKFSTLKLGWESEENNSESYNDIDSYTRILRGHSSTVYSAKFCSENRTILSCSRDATVRAWSLDSFTNTAIYLGHNYPIWALDISRMGHYFVTASQDHTARLWSFDRNYPLRMFGDGHVIDVDSISFHPNCNYVATGSSDRTVRLWDVQTGEAVRSYYGNRNSVMALAFSPNGKLLAAAGEDRKIKIWDLASGNMLKDLRGHTDTIYTLKFNSCSSILASGGADESIRLWDVSNESWNNSSGLDSKVSPELLSQYSIKSCSVLYLQYMENNVLYTSGKVKDKT